MFPKLPCPIEPLIESARRCGLPLNASDAQMLILAHENALDACGRIELEGGILSELIECFASSPYLSEGETLCALIEIFDHLKNDTEDRIDDDRLLRAMRKTFDDCRGSTEWMLDHLQGGLHG